MCTPTPVGVQESVGPAGRPPDQMEKDRSVLLWHRVAEAARLVQTAHETTTSPGSQRLCHPPVGDEAPHRDLRPTGSKVLAFREGTEGPGAVCSGATFLASVQLRSGFTLATRGDYPPKLDIKVEDSTCAS